MGSEAATPTTLRAPLAVRVGWHLLVGLPLVLFVLSIPSRYGELFEVSRRMSALPDVGDGLLQRFLARGSYYALGVLSLEIVFVLAFALTCVALVWRSQFDLRPMFFSAVFMFYSIWVTPTLDALALPPALQTVADLTQAAGVFLAVSFFLLFPDGRFVPRWTWVSSALWLPYCLAWGIFPDAWFSLIDPFEASFTAFLILILLGWGVGLAAQAVRYRRANQQERFTTKWVMIVIAGACVGYGAVYLPDVFLPESGYLRALYDLFGVPTFWLFALPIPITLAIAVQRYHLFNVERILQRTLVYGVLTACVAGLYILMVGGMGTLLQDRSHVLVSLFATGLVAVLFAPLRDRLQRAANRLIYGERDDPYAALSRLGQRLEATLSPNAMLPTVVKTVAEALKLPYAAIEMRKDGVFSTVASFGDPVKAPFSLPLVYGGVPVGRLVMGRRAGEEAFSPADQRLLDDLARQAGIAVHAARLAEDAHRLSDDLQRSRERLVAAREEERRRLRRDLHDGLGPQLAAVTMKAEAARDLLESFPERSGVLLEEITTQAQEAVADIRRLVYGLRPPALDDLGLIGALRAQAANSNHNGLRVKIEAPEDLPSLPAAVEVAAYRIIQEALTNAARHAAAHNCTVRITPDEQANVLRLEVNDNGRGITEYRRAGVGLFSMRERAGELGGSFRIEALDSGGTGVRAVLPLARGVGEGEMVASSARET